MSADEEATAIRESPREHIEILYDDGSTMLIEGFGPYTILGAMIDLLAGSAEYKPEGKNVMKITVFPKAQ